ncbi:MAG: tetratricopeptide repeat protein [Pontibacterium sp.]
MIKTLLITATLTFSFLSPIANAADFGAGERAFKEQNYGKALKELLPLARDGHGDAANLLGQMYENGWGVDKSRATAERMYIVGADQGNIDSLNFLRAMKEPAFIKEFNETKPLAESGRPGAMNRLGEMYEHGYGTRSDIETAVQWYKKAAEAGLDKAMVNLGRAYNYGNGIEQDFAQAEFWYMQAIAQNNADGMFYMGTLYANKLGQDKSRHHDITSFAWMRNASLRGNGTAKAIEVRLLMKIPDENKAEAVALAETFRLKYVSAN